MTPRSDLSDLPLADSAPNPRSPAADDHHILQPGTFKHGANATSIHPWLFCILMIPFGAGSGYVSVTLGSLLERGGVSVKEVAWLLSLSVLPHTLKVFWAPLVDVSLSPKWWYLISGLLTAVSVGMLGAFPADKSGLAALGWCVLLGGVAASVLGMAVDSLMAHGTAEEAKGRAGGWSQAGNLGGSGLGGGLGLLIAVRVPELWMASGFIALLCAFCCLPLVWLPSSAREFKGSTILTLLKATLLDVWRTVRVRRGILALLLCVVPLGIGASSGLWSIMAPEWNTGPDTVAVVTGVLGGLVSAAGCLAGGFICDRWSRQACYVGFGLAVCVAGLAMAFFPHTPAMFITTTLLISFTTGMSWAGYAAFVLEAIGRGAAATKFSAFAWLANMPIYYMNLVNGWSQEKWGTTGMIQFEAAMGVAGAVVFLIAAKFLLPPRHESGTPSVPPAPVPGG